MSNDALSLSLVVAALLIVFVPAGLSYATRWWRRRSPTQGVSITTLDGEPATLLRQLTPVQVGASMVTLLGVLSLTTAWAVLDRSPDQIFWVIVLGAVGIYFVVAGVYLHLGRYDQSLWLTRDKVIQSHKGARQEIRWGDITDVFRTRTGPGLVTLVSPEFRRTTPRFLLGGPKQPDHVLDEAGNPMPEFVFALHIAELYPRTYLIGSLLTWFEHPELRTEIGTDLATDRLLVRQEPPESPPGV